MHLLLSDVMMPGLDGPGLAEQLRVVRPDVRVIFMSAYGHEFSVLLDRSPFVQKPFLPITLLEKEFWMRWLNRQSLFVAVCRVSFKVITDTRR